MLQKGRHMQTLHSRGHCGTAIQVQCRTAALESVSLGANTRARAALQILRRIRLGLSGDEVVCLGSSITSKGLLSLSIVIR